MPSKKRRYSTPQLTQGLFRLNVGNENVWRPSQPRIVARKRTRDLANAVSFPFFVHNEGQGVRGLQGNLGSSINVQKVLGTSELAALEQLYIKCIIESS